MQVTVEQLDPCKEQLTIEVDADTVDKTIDQVYREYNKVTSVPGFRKGKTPRAILERVVSPDSIKQRTIEKLVPDAYEQAIQQENIEPYAEPDIEIQQYEPGKPFVFKTVIQLAPKIELGEYKGIEVERPKVEVTDKDVEDELLRIQKSRAKTEPVEGRGVEANDIIVADIVAYVEGTERPEPQRGYIHLGESLPGFDENLIGAMPSETRSFSIDVPEDWESADIAGKTVNYEITVHSITREILPEIDDEFAKSLGDFESLDALKERIRNDIEEVLNRNADYQVESLIIDEILNRSDINVPDVLVNENMQQKIKKLVDNLSKQGLSFDEYLSRIGKSPEEYADEVRGQALRDVKIGLMLGEIAMREGIEITDEDKEKEIDKMAEQMKMPRETVESLFATDSANEYMNDRVLTEKIINYLKSVSVIKE